MIKITAKWATKGITTDVNTCEFCGRTHLRKAVILAALDAEGNATGEIAHAGTTCAARRLNVTAYRVTKSAGLAERKRAELAARRADMTEDSVTELRAELTALGVQIARAINFDHDKIKAEALKIQRDKLAALLYATAA